MDFKFPPITPQPPRPNYIDEMKLPLNPEPLTSSDMGFQVQCPSCGGGVWIAYNEINCAIFRHAVYKSNGQQIPPHSSAEECQRLIDSGLVDGCAKPFRIEAVPFYEETASTSDSMDIEKKYKAVLCGFI